MLGDVQPHPGDRAAQNNVLDTKFTPPTAGVQLSLASLGRRKPGLAQKTPTSVPKFRSVFASTRKTTPSTDSSQDSSEDTSSRSDAPEQGQEQRSRFGEGNAALVLVPTKDTKDPLKRRKPKSSITKGHSSFISRATPADSLSKRLQERQSDGLYALANITRALYWLDMLSATKVCSMTTSRPIVSLQHNRQSN